MNSIGLRVTYTVLAATTASLISALLPIPATAAQDQGEAQAASATIVTDNCPLERIERQYLRCDNLTGAGVPAPLWVKERP